MSETRHLGDARRILVYGVTGSGKTAFARDLAEVCGLPWTEADQLCWGPGWTEVPKEEQRRRIGEVCAGDSWVLDTAYGSWLELVMERVEVVVALDLPRRVSLSRLLRRTFVRVVTRREVCNGNVESWSRAFSTDSIIVWHFRSFRRKRDRIRRWVSSETGPAVVWLRSSREAAAWLERLRARQNLSLE